MVIEFAAGICVLAAVICTALWWRARTGREGAEAQRDAAETAAARAAANLGTAPLMGFLWRGDSADAVAIAAGDESFAEFVAGLEPAAAAGLETALVELRANGSPF